MEILVPEVSAFEVEVAVETQCKCRVNLNTTHILFQLSSYMFQPCT